MALQTNQTKTTLTPPSVAKEWLDENPHRKAENMTGQFVSDVDSTRQYRNSNVHLFDKDKKKEAPSSKQKAKSYSGNIVSAKVNSFHKDLARLKSA